MSKTKLVFFFSFILIVSSLIYCFSAPFVGATELFSDGFESGNFSTWTNTDILNANIDVVSSLAHHGTYCAAVTNINGGDYAWVYKSFTATNLVYARLYVRLPSVPVQGQVYFAVAMSAGGYTIFPYFDGTSNKWGLFNGHSPAFYDESGTSTLAADTWYCIEFRVTRHATAGIAQLWVDGVQKVDQSGIDTGDNDINAIYFGCYTANAQSTARTVYIDCCVIADTYIGPEFTAHIVTLTLEYTATLTASFNTAYGLITALTSAFNLNLLLSGLHESIIHILTLTLSYTATLNIGFILGTTHFIVLALNAIFGLNLDFGDIISITPEEMFVIGAVFAAILVGSIGMALVMTRRKNDDS